MATKYTVHEHYVPQSYLKAFSDSTSEKHIWRYDLTGEYSIKSVPINSVCFVDHLYEIKNEAGEYIQRNEVEKLLQKYETSFCKVRQRILNRINCINPGSTKTIASKEYKTICEMIAIQICRMPQSINIAKQRVREFMNEDNMEQSFISMLALAFLLPLNISAIKNNIPGVFNILKSRKNTPPLVEEFLRRMKEKKFAIGYAPKGNIPTTDLPVFVSRDLNYDNNRKIFDFDLLIYPLSPSLVMFMWSDLIRSDLKENELFVLKEKHVIRILRDIATVADRWLYSKKPLNRKERKIISEARRIKTYEPDKPYDGSLYK